MRGGGGRGRKGERGGEGGAEGGGKAGGLHEEAGPPPSFFLPRVRSWDPPFPI